MVKLPLERGRESTGSAGCKQIHWKTCLPFLENKLATLIHRPRYITTYRIGQRPPHLAVGNWCGNTMTGQRKFTFLPAPPSGRIVCARCEENAVRHGLPTTDELAGRHVHKGGVIAVPHCCEA